MAKRSKPGKGAKAAAAQPGRLKIQVGPTRPPYGSRLKPDKPAKPKEKR